MTDWVSQAGGIPGLHGEDRVALAGESMIAEDFRALPAEIQMASVANIVEALMGLFKRYSLGVSLIRRFYSDKQRVHERPEKYILRKKVLFWMAGAIQPDTLEFREPLLRGLLPTLKVTSGPIDPATASLQETEKRVRSAPGGIPGA